MILREVTQKEAGSIRLRSALRQHPVRLVEQGDAGTLPANDDFEVGGAFAPILIREGAGVNVRLVRGRVSYLDWRGGFGLRQSRFRGAFTQDSAGPNVVRYPEVESFNEEGLETTVVGTVR